MDSNLYLNSVVVYCCLFTDKTAFTLSFVVQVSPLLLATHQGHIKAVKVLLDYPRIDVTLTNKAGYNALAEAIVKGYK